MKLRTFRYFFHEAFTSLGRNNLLSIASATTMAVCILILGIGVLLFVNTGEITAKLESEVEIVAFLKPDLSPYQKDDLEYKFKQLSGVKSVTFVSKEAALNSLGKRLGDGQYNLSETLEGGNPLPDSYKIKAVDPHQVPQLAKQIASMDGVDKIRYGQALVQKLFGVTRWVRAISLFIVIFLALAAIFLVATTIRLAIFSRRKEIYLMKLVGATDWFIRLPFFIEGMTLALIGAILAVLALGYGYYYLIDNMKTAMSFIPLVHDAKFLTNLYLSLIGTGLGLGLIGTYISVNKFLDV